MISHPSPTVSKTSDFTQVMLESPFAGDVQGNIAYARSCMGDCIRRGEAPFASHLLYTQDGVLDDNKPEERLLGMQAGMAFAMVCKKTVVYIDKGISNGMFYGIMSAREVNRPIEFRSLDHNLVLKDNPNKLFFDSTEGLEMGLNYTFEQMRLNPIDNAED